MCKLAVTEDCRVFHKIIFRGSPIIHSFSNGVVGETVNETYKIKVMGNCVILFGNGPIQLTQCCTQFKPLGNKTFCFRNFLIMMQIQYTNRSICFRGLIYCDRTWLLFLDLQITLLSSVNKVFKIISHSLFMCNKCKDSKNKGMKGLVSKLKLHLWWGYEYNTKNWLYHQLRW